MRSPDADGDDASSSSPDPDLDQDQEDSDEMQVSKDERSAAQTSPQGDTRNGNNKDNKPHAKSNAKDPSRPRRKKARRACFACQRAHLTCGDERPCERCIKRGLQDHCQDGVRKKAKYLHDAPAEALKPGFTKNYAMNGARPSASTSTAPVVGSNGMATQQSVPLFPQTSSGGYPHYGSISEQSPLTTSMMNNVPMGNDFGQQHSLETPAQFHATTNQQMSPDVGALSGDANQIAGLGGPGNSQFNSSFIDPSDPTLLGFDVADLNFDNHYGALEFGMLGHMSSAAAGNSEIDLLNSMGQNQGGLYDGFNPNFNYNQNLQSWQTVPNPGSRSNSANNMWNVPPNGMDAFAVGDYSSVYSPHSQNQDPNAGYQPSTLSPESQFAQPESGSQQQELLRRSLSHAQQEQRQERKKSAFPSSFNAGVTTQRHDTSEIYNSVSAPYPYTQRFHALIAFLQKHFPSRKVLGIAKALASIRPTFISCNKSLDTTDLIFAEKCLQRTLVEYENLVGHYGTPTVIIRRTGEIAAANKEFSLITGWRRDVLLGKEPNLNVNIGGAHASGTQTGTSTRGAATPRIPHVEIDTSQPQPVFIAELLDEDSVVGFYEDFAEGVFGASRPCVIGKECSLLKYKTKEDMGWRTGDAEGRAIETSSPAMKKPRRDQPSRGPAGVQSLGEKNGRVDCQLVWTVKRDIFDMPMLVTINFLPEI